MTASSLFGAIGFLIFSIMGVSQTSKIIVSPVQPDTTFASPQPTEASVSSRGYGYISPPLSKATSAPAPATPVLKPTPITSDISNDIPKPTTAGTPPQTTNPPVLPIKCGANSAGVYNECGAGVFKNAHAQCYDGFNVAFGETTSCKPAEVWYQYIKESCANHCSNGSESGIVPKSIPQSSSVPPRIIPSDNIGGGNRSTPTVPLTQKPVEAPKTTPVCYINDDLFQKYSQLISELQKSESDETRTEEITKQITELKQRILVQQNECVKNSPQPTPTIVPWPAPILAPRSTPTGSPIAIENSSIPATNKPVAVEIDRCNEVVQWETKISYYKKLSTLSVDDLKKNGFSREEIEKILQELALGVEKVKIQCRGQEKTPSIPHITAITGSASITETVNPVVASSGQEISSYYKARIEKTVSTNGGEKQIEDLKTLRDEIDGLISNLIKSRKELEVSELNALVKEVTVSRGEIKADGISVKTTEKKMLVNVGTRPVSVEPTANQVLIRDKELKVDTNEVAIKENALSVGGVEVKMSASEVTEKLGLEPKTIELKKENEKAVYSMKIEEPRKLFWFIPINSKRTVTANAENGQILSEKRPWYSFLTTK